jgi:DNA polymerase bacteriophage-type
MSLLLDADYAAIEARIVCWLAGQQDALDEFRQGVDRYKRMASVIYGIPEKDVNKFPQRFVGKSAVLGCIAEGELVLTDYGLVPIEKICSWHRVWDGVEWVHHEGLIHQGHKEVFTYQGLTATPDHTIFAFDRMGFQRTASLQEARKQNLTLVVSGEGRNSIRTVDAFDRSSIFQSHELPEHESSVRMRNDIVQGSWNPSERTELGVRSLCSFGFENSSGSHMADKAHGSSEGQMYQPEMQNFQMVWSEGDRVQVQISNSRCQLDHGQFRFEEAPNPRQEEQRRTLPARKHALCNAADAGIELHSRENGLRIFPGRVAVCEAGSCEVSQAWDDEKTGDSPSRKSGIREEKMLEDNSKKIVATYDLLNAGPRHRFTVSNKLVHNCGFGLGPRVFRASCLKVGKYDLPPDLEFAAIEKWRATHPQVPKMWKGLEKAAKEAIINKGKVCSYLKISFKCQDIEGMPFLLLRLPSGRKLAYPRPRVRPHKRFEGNTEIVFFGHQKGVQWGDVETWGGTLAENATQAVAADIMCHGAQNAENAGYEIMSLIHDQALAYHKPHQTPEEFVRLLTDLPGWADGLPIAAEGGLVPFYKKD